VLRSLVTSTILKSLFSSVWELSTPKGISFMWGFGRFLGGLIILQISSGLLLAFYYVGGVQAWDSIVEISREVWFGWGFRLIHRNNASFLFVVLFIHFFSRSFLLFLLLSGSLTKRVVYYVFNNGRGLFRICPSLRTNVLLRSHSNY